MSLNLSEKEKWGVKIGKKDVEGVLAGFNHSIIYDVFTTKEINDQAFID